MKKWIWISLVIILVGGGIAWFFLQKDSQTNQSQSTTQTTTVKKGKLEVAISGSGSVTASTDQDVTVANTVLVVDSVSVISGEDVDKGDTLITFTNGETVTAPNSGEIASVLVKSGSVASKGTILLRLTNEDDVTSPITRNTSNSEMGSSGGISLVVDTVKVAKGDVVTKGTTIASFTDGSILQAPVAGTITSLAIASGDSVDSSTAVAHITDYTSLQTTISVDELDISKVKVKQAVEISASAFEDETFAGVVTAVATEGSSENGVSSFDVTVKITDPKSLKIGMSTEAKILIESKDNALYVPVEAVYTSGNEKYVLKASSSSETGEKQTVEIGIANDTYVEITSGLSEEDSVQLPQVKSNNNSTGRNNMQGGFGGGQMPGGQGERPSGNGSPSGNPPSGGGRGGN
ncbi:efflux RND transporter periplasmic adaptor subunit [Bacillus massiliigorillae]|uniref:efflux RND transporter periplasmic adaptor subunit n=1 Tax=Bacillus massiliigorillae TaxID=1243664 RepID=UPI0003A94E4B|nr:HlyD family efflux transporter periplasmic adaptor subunit [Bacillus massiliigorillae]